MLCDIGAGQSSATLPVFFMNRARALVMRLFLEELIVEAPNNWGRVGFAMPRLRRVLIRLLLWVV